MYNEPIFLDAVFQERIWGGKNLASVYDYDLPYDRTGEAWVISAHPNGPNEILNGPLAGKTLADVWHQHGELFNNNDQDEAEYPLLVKVIDANDDLSVQVHPDDTYAREIEGVPYGKTECWYVLQAESDAEIVFGHHAKTKNELNQLMDEGKWDDLLRKKKVEAGDFIYVPSGTIHAIGKGIMILEIQQSSDITYRVYDYDRKDKQGHLRELHLDKAKEVITVPHSSSDFHKEVEEDKGLISEKLMEEQYFTVYHWKLDGEVTRELTEDFLQVSVIEGSGKVEVDGQLYEFSKGSHYIIPHTIKTYALQGQAELIVSHV